MKRMFVTGGAGFIGSHLVDRLVAEGNDVTVYDNLSTGNTGNIKHHFEDNRFKFIEGDLLDCDTLAASLEVGDVVFHLAAHADVREGIDNTRIDLDNETIATYNLLEVMREKGIDKMVFASSATVYGETPPLPLSESYGPTLPISLYGAGKLACEGLISAYCHTFDIQAWVFRFANVIGSRSRHGVIYDFVNKLTRNPAELEILGDGTQERPYIHVSECVDGILYGFNHSDERLNLFNIGVESSTDVTTLAGIVAGEMGRYGVNFNYTGGSRGWKGDAPQVRFDMTKMKGIGWEARLTSDEAIRRATGEIIMELEQCRR